MKHTNEYVREQIRKKAFDDYDMSQVQITVTKFIKLDDVLALLGAQEKELREAYKNPIKLTGEALVIPREKATREELQYSSGWKQGTSKAIREFLGGGAEKEAHP